MAKENGEQQQQHFNMPTLSLPSDCVLGQPGALSPRDNLVGADAPEGAGLIKAFGTQSPVEGKAALEANIRATAGTVFHPCGTARMGSDDRAVLDPELRVRGVEGLRVADASVFPLIPSPNIQPAALMVGERCADFLRRAA